MGEWKLWVLFQVGDTCCIMSGSIFGVYYSMIPFVIDCGVASTWSISSSHPLAPSPFIILSIGRNWRCRCGWLAPLWSPELKNAKSLLFLSCPCPFSHALRHAYVTSRSSCSSWSVCGLFVFVASMKCSEMIGNLFRTRRWVGFVVGTSAIKRSAGGLSKGSGFFVCGFSFFWAVGFFANDGQYRSWN